MVRRPVHKASGEGDEEENSIEGEGGKEEEKDLETGWGGDEGLLATPVNPIPVEPATQETILGGTGVDPFPLEAPGPSTTKPMSASPTSPSTSRQNTPG